MDTDDEGDSIQVSQQIGIYAPNPPNFAPTTGPGPMAMRYDQIYKAHAHVSHETFALTTMGIRGYIAYRYKGEYYREYIEHNAHPGSGGLDLLQSIPRNPETLKKWIEKLSNELLDEESRYRSFEPETFTDSNWTLGGNDIEWTYVIDLDNQVFTVNGLFHFKFDNLPPLQTSGSELGFADYFCHYRHGVSPPEIPEKHLTSLKFWPKLTFDAEKAQQEYSTLQPTVAALSEWNAPTWDTLSVAQHLSTSLIKTLVNDFSDELALCYYSATWIRLGVFCWNVANSAATAHLLCPPVNSPHKRSIGYILDVGFSMNMLNSPKLPAFSFLKPSDIQGRFYWFRGCLITFCIRLDDPAYMTHQVVEMVEQLRKNDRTQGVGIIMSSWHLVAVTINGTNVHHSPALELHDGKEPKDGVLLLMHLLSPTFTRSKAPWITPSRAQQQGRHPTLPDEVLRQIIRFTSFETYARLSKVSRYFRSTYLAEPRIGNYTLLGYQGVSSNSNPMFRVQRRDSTDSQLAVLKRVKTCLNPSQKALPLRRYRWDFCRVEPIIQLGLGGMFQYHKPGSKCSYHTTIENTKDGPLRVAAKPITFLDIVRGEECPTLRVQALDGIWKMVGVGS